MNLVGSGSAIYGSSHDWELLYQIVPAGQTPDLFADLASLSITPCVAVTGSSCQVTTPAGTIIVVVQVDYHSFCRN